MLVIKVTLVYSISTEPPLSFSHNPGSMFIFDTTVDEYFNIHKPEHGDEQPRLITLTDQPYLASVCSASAIQKIKEIAKISLSPSSTEGTEDPEVASEFLQIAVRLSHAPFVVIGFLPDKESFLDVIQGAMALVKALQALNKKITIVTQHNAQQFQDSITASAARGQLSKQGICVVEYDGSSDIKDTIFQGGVNHRLDTVLSFQVTREPKKDNSKGSSRGNLVDSFLQEGRLLCCIDLTHCRMISWGYSSEFLVGVYRLLLQILTLFQTKLCHFLCWLARFTRCH